MDWVTVIRKEAQTSSILRTDELARKYGIIPAAVTQALSRHEQKGLVEHVSNKIYYNWLALDGSPRDLVNILRVAQNHYAVSSYTHLCDHRTPQRVQGSNDQDQLP
jgi:Mn-dependent DtxR family transcriptional regulator